MTSGEPLWDRWAEVDRLFSAALDRQPAERTAYLESASGGDRELIALVMELLRADAAAGAFLDAPGSAATRLALEDLGARTDQPRAIGRYTILRELGRGGMGTVYLGELEGDGFRQQVAIKLLRRGLDTDDIVRRFLTERRILASLNHPHIARLFDGGATDEARPFLVMEYVEGDPITTYCDRKQIGIPQRLKLCLNVCDAVSAAHASLVVHRDLKPSNILVGADGRAKLLDFGIAKLLGPDEGTDHTQTGVHVLTPEHASPEQLRGERITTATDVYQLGVLLFELLTGRRPHLRQDSGAGAQQDGYGRDAPSPSSVVHVTGPDGAAVARARGTTPAQLRRALKGDLDTIVQKALHPSPERRYASAEQLATDIRRLLSGRTITARPETFRYRSATFLRRHRWVLPAAAAAMVVVVLYAVTIVRHTRQLQAERNAAALQAERALEAQRFLVDLFRSADPYAPADPERGRRITVVEALDVGTRRLADSLGDRPIIRASILNAISEVYTNLGASDRARPLREEALALERSIYGEDSPQVRASVGQLGRILGIQGDQAAALALHEQRLSSAVAVGASEAEVAAARVPLGLHLIGMSRPADAEPHLAAVAAGAEGADAADVAEAQRALSDVYRMLDRLDESEQAARKALALKQALGEQSVGTALAHVTLAQALGELGNHAEAEAHFAQALPILEEILGDDHRLALITLNNLAVLRQSAGNLAGAEALQRRHVELLRRLYGEAHHLVGDSLQNLATILGRIGRFDEARPLHEQAAAIYAGALDADNYLHAFPRLSLAAIHLAQRDYRAAERVGREALAILERALPPNHYATEVARCRVARALAGRGRFESAAPLFQHSSTALMATRSVPEYRTECLEAAAAFYDARGEPTRAAPLRVALAAR